MLLLVSLDQTTAYLYYYWNNDENTFKKSEKLALTVINDDILFPVEE
jgi:hypothetical protein